MTFGVMVSLVLLELLPESYVLFSYKTNSIPLTLLIVIGILSAGFLILKILDHFIPDHEKEGEGNLLHIGLLSSIAIMIHNIIEGVAVYSTVVTIFNSGLLLAIGVGLHNIPLGMALSSSFYNKEENKYKSKKLIIAISLSTFIGGLLMFLNASTTVFGFSYLFTAVMITITAGMLIYISFMEILPKLIEEKDKKTVVISTAIGIIILLVSRLFG
jgi:ZIP family zinc transporter